MSPAYDFKVILMENISVLSANKHIVSKADSSALKDAIVKIMNDANSFYNMALASRQMAEIVSGMEVAKAYCETCRELA